MITEIASAEMPKRVVLPDRLSLPVMTTPDGVLRSWEEIESRFNAGDPYICGWVSRTMKAVEEQVARPDGYYFGLFRPETPFGRSTLTCPFHPRMFGWMPFEWDPDHPWRLTCPHCREEGRKPDYYPNELYPDDGRGCRPTDEVWRKTHTPDWSAKYRIPWEKWDGHTHGHIDGFTFFFLGHAQFRIFFELNWRHNILGTLCNGYVFGSRLYSSGSPERALADVCAHKARIIMVTMARAIMGDSYLRDVLEITPDHYRQAIQSLATNSVPYIDYPGYERRDTISDHSANDPEHPLETVRSYWRRQTTFFPDRMYSGWSNRWLTSYAMIQDSFTPVERDAGLSELIERLLVSKDGDAERLKKRDRTLRRGVIEYGMRPYSLSMRGNLSGDTALSNLNLGLMLNDHQITRDVAADLWYYLRNYFTGDGLGHETSAHYTHVALNGTLALLAQLNGMKEGFGPGDPFWDTGTEALNPYLDPALAAAAYSTLLSVLPDGRCVPWVDSWITEQPSMKMIEKIANATGAVSERFLPWLDVSTDAKGELQVSLKKELTLPSYVIGANGLAVMRTGVGADQTFVSVDWSRATGHSHSGPFNLLLYGARHEMLFDQGYLNNVTPTQDWMNSAESHNTALVRTASGSANDCLKWRGSLRFFADTPVVKAVEVAEENTSLLRSDDQPVMYQRTVVLMAADSPYVVDIFRLQGGSTHDYYVHSLGETFSMTGATLRPVPDQKKSLYDVSGFEYNTQTGARVITGISQAVTNEDVTATWRDMKDWRTIPPEMDKDAVTRVRILGVPGTEILVGKSFGQRYIGSRDVDDQVTVMCVRRKAETFHEVPDAFVAVIDAVRGETDDVRQIRRLEVLSGDDAGVAIRVTRPGGIDYILSTTQDDVPTTFVDPDDEKKITLTGRLGVIRIDAGKPVALVLVQGKHLAIGDETLTATAASLDGRLVGFNNHTMVLTVESDAAIPTGTELAGRTLVVRHNRQSSTFTIGKIDRLGSNQYTIALANTSNLAEWMVRVKSVTGESVTIEPTPTLPREKDSFVYREDAAGRVSLLAPYSGKTQAVSDEGGTHMTNYTTVVLPNSFEGFKLGARLLISSLQVGQDTVSIPVIKYKPAQKIEFSTGG